MDTVFAPTKPVVEDAARIVPLLLSKATPPTLAAVVVLALISPTTTSPAACRVKLPPTAASLAAAVMVTLPAAELKAMSVLVALTSLTSTSTSRAPTPVPVAWSLREVLLVVQLAVPVTTSSRLTWVPNRVRVVTPSLSKLSLPKVNAVALSPKLRAAKLLFTMAEAKAVNCAALALLSKPPCKTNCPTVPPSKVTPASSDKSSAVILSVPELSTPLRVTPL